MNQRAPSKLWDDIRPLPPNPRVEIGAERERHFDVTARWNVRLGFQCSSRTNHQVSPVTTGVDDDDGKFDMRSGSSKKKKEQAALSVSVCVCVCAQVCDKA